MRIGFLASHPIQYLAPLLRELATLVDLHVFYAHDPSPQQQAAAGFDVAFKWDTDLFEGYPHTFLPNAARHPDARAGHFFGCDTPELYGEITVDRFDVFIVNGWYLKSFWQAVWACKKAGIPVLARGDSQLQTPRHWVKRATKQIGYRMLLRSFDGFLSVGRRFDEYLRHYGVPSERILRVPHAVDNEWFAQKAREAVSTGLVEDLQKKLGLTRDAVTLLFVGKFIEVKRAHDILRALRILQNQGLTVSAVYVGDGPMRLSLTTEAERLGVSAHFVGFKNQSELPAYYALADALVLPSKSETWGLVVNEAMATGTPAIVSDAVGCRPDLIIEGETGYSYPVGDVVALASAVEQLIMDCNVGVDFALFARTHIDRYSVEAAAKGVVEAAHAVVQL
jgi:glycosyltransferase involved in cell wall biosynthesis